MRISILTMALAIGLTAIAAVPANAGRIDEARAAVEATLDRLGVDRSRVKSVYLAPNLDNGSSRPPPSYTGWVSLKDCTGNLVIELHRTAAVRTMYTTGDCVVPGV